MDKIKEIETKLKTFAEDFEYVADAYDEEDDEVVIFATHNQKARDEALTNLAFAYNLKDGGYDEYNDAWLITVKDRIKPKLLNIEKYLLSHDFKKEKEYDSGVIVYTNKEVDPEYEVTVTLFTKHNPICWEVYFNNPYGVHLMSYKDSDPKQKAENIRAFTEDLIRSAFYFEKQLKAVENPWEELKDE